MLMSSGRGSPFYSMGVIGESMIAGATNAALYAEWLGHIEAEETKDAFTFIVGLAAALMSYTCHPQHKGVVRDFRFFLSETQEMPFAFIPNKSWLLFYFRAPAVRSRAYSPSTLKDAFEDSFVENARGEWTVKLRCVSDVKRLWSILALS
jgi:hypothetical protein